MQPAFEYADGAFFVHSTLLSFHVFFISAESHPRFFVNFVAGLATKCPVKKHFGHAKGWFNWTTSDGDAHSNGSFVVVAMANVTRFLADALAKPAVHEHSLTAQVDATTVAGFRHRKINHTYPGQILRGPW